MILDDPKKSDQTNPDILRRAADKMTAEISTSSGAQRATFESMINTIAS